MEDASSTTKCRMPNSTFEDEKPTFYTNQQPPGPSEPFVLSETAQVPYTINRYLRSYQREGVKFIYDGFVKSRGCILGDDMGLGKTVQVISFLAAVLQKTGTWKDVENNRPEFLQTQGPSGQTKVKKIFLIVAPLSVLYNWKDELDTWGHFKTVVIHGVRKEEELARVNRGRCEIALTTYETLRLCLEQFNSIDWTAVIADEVHKLKNCKSQVSQAMKELTCKVRVGLTGTILQNNLEELWSVMDWAVPGCLGSLGGFKNRFSDPIEQGQKHSTTKRALAEGRKAVQTLSKRLYRLFLRRTKAIISQQLPKKDDRVVYCAMTDFQRTIYRAVLDTDDVKLILRSSEACPCCSGRSRRKCCFKFNSDCVPVRNLYFSYLAILRKVANHVALLQSKEETSKKQEKLVTAVCEQVFKKFPDFTDRCKQAAFEAMSDPIYSGKMKVLHKLLNHAITRKDKVLLFSLSTKLLDVLESYCMAEGLEYRRLDGTTKSKDRIHIVKEFNRSNDINLCLVSTMAGGLGLNFVGANSVVLFDPTWNPANDLQAIDRAYRIGQFKDVTVFRLISLGTVEEIIYLRQIYKQQLQLSVIGKENTRRYFEAVQGADGQAGELFGIRNLFRFQTNGTCLTHQILEREGRLEVGIMTASTKTMDERMRELQEPKVVSADVSTEQAHLPAVTHGTSARLADPGVLDFSSASEDEDPCSSRLKINDPIAQDEFGATNGCASNLNLFALLQRHLSYGTQMSSISSDENQFDENKDSKTLKKTKAWGNTEGFLSSDSEEETNKNTARRPYRSLLMKNIKTAVSSEMEESQDLQSHDINLQQKDAVTNKKQNRARVAAQRQRYEDEIESFTSSEDEAPVKSVACKKRHASILQQNKSASRCFLTTQSNVQKAVQFTGLNSLSSHRKKAGNKEGPSTGTIDTLLGGLPEVAYTHSNQKVVGSSTVENCLSHAALRDVFKLKRHSQVPANHLSDHDELSETTDNEEVGQMLAQHVGTHLKHQVTHSIRTSIHTHSAIISVGETSAATCKQQLEDMAQFFGAKSAEEFAKELVESNSVQRLRCLSEFYSHSNPELTDVIQKIFVKPATKLKSPVSPTTAAYSTSRQKPTSKRTHLSSIQRPQEKAVGPLKKKGKLVKQASEVLHCYCGGRSNSKNDNSSSLPIDPSQGEPSFRMSTDVHPQRQENSTDLVLPVRGPSRDQVSGPGVNNHADTDSSHTTKTLVSDLLGDTSILDELLRPKRNGAQTKQTSPTPTEKTKTRQKDFWDILNEGNEESINKLTDPSQLEKFCKSINVSTKTKCDTTHESSQLWKKNEKFLWK